MVASREVEPDLWVLGSSQASPGHGHLPVNAFVLAGDRPVLVDTGLPDERESFMEALRQVVPVGGLASVFVTHEDPDHAGNLGEVLAAEPQAELVLGWVTLNRLLETSLDLPLDRVRIVGHGDLLPGTDERVQVVRPPLYDSPGTLGLHDGRTGALLTVDAFGTYLPEPMDDLDGLDDDTIRAGLTTFNLMNHPWVGLAEPRAFELAVDAAVHLAPRLVLSSHGAVARAEISVLAEAMRALPGAAPYVPPDHDQFLAWCDELG
jgi:flavorubredoxin